MVGTFRRAEGCHDATGGTVGGQIGYRWQASQPGCSASKRQGNWADLQRLAMSACSSTRRSRTARKIDAFGLFTGQIGYAWNNVLLYVKGGAAVTDRSLSACFATGVPAVVGTGEREPAGAARSAPAWNLASLRTGRPASNTTTCSWATATIASRSPIAGGALSRTDRIRQDVDLVTVRVNYRWGGPVIAKY